MTCELFLSVMYINVVPCICFIIVRLVHSQMRVARELLSSTVHVKCMSSAQSKSKSETEGEVSLCQVTMAKPALL